jgi:hypothetical protein
MPLRPRCERYLLTQHIKQTQYLGEYARCVVFNMNLFPLISKFHLSLVCFQLTWPLSCDDGYKISGTLSVLGRIGIIGEDYKY